MKAQTGLAKLTKRFFEIAHIPSLDEWNNFYQQIDKKWNNILKFKNEGGEQPDFISWQNLYEITCGMMNEIEDNVKDLQFPLIHQTREQWMEEHGLIEEDML